VLDEIKLCECGCELPTAVTTRTRKGVPKGTPHRYIHGHNSVNKKIVVDENTTVFCACGCGQLTSTAKFSLKRKDQVIGQPMEFVHGHNRRKPGPEYEVDQVTGCWNWLLGLSSGRYGNRNNIAAHRRYYETYKGAIPEGLEIDHLCFNTKCVNPDHLEAVTQQENIRRRAARNLRWKLSKPRKRRTPAIQVGK
jgi:hypothetical protein